MSKKRQITNQTNRPATTASVSLSLDSVILRSSLHAVTIVFLLLATPISSFGAWQIQPPEVSPSKLAAESIRHQDRLLVGLIVSETKKEISIAVDRDWLQATQPDHFPSYRQREQDRLAPILQQYQQRFAAWIADQSDDDLKKELAFQLDRIEEENSIDGLEKKTFMLMTLPRTEVTRIKRQSDKRKRIAALAWQHNFAKVAKRSATDLTQELKSKDIDLKNTYVNLSSQLPAMPLTDTQWALRKAMFQYDYFKEMNFQGQDETLFHVTPETKIDQLMAGMMKDAQSNSLQRLGRELGLPEFQPPTKTDWLKSLTDQADQAGHQSIMVKRIVSGQDADLVTVDGSFFAKTEQGWQLVKSVGSQSRLTQQPRAKLDALRADPQVTQALAMAKQLGLGNDGLIDQALRKGAATQQALTSVSEKLDALIGENTLRLEAPWTLD